MSQDTFSLVLHSQFSKSCIDNIPAIVKALQLNSFIGGPIKEFGINHFLVGSNFLDMISFLGCSPNIRLFTEKEGIGPGDHQGSESYAHIQVGTSSTPFFVDGDIGTFPRCVFCKSNLEIEALSYQEADDIFPNLQITCSGCQKILDQKTINWRHSAGLVQEFVAIHGIYPHEAVPDDRLLDQLCKVTSVPWQFFYCRNF